VKLAYISDQKYYCYDNKWYTTASLAIDQLSDAICNEITHWVLFGRIEYLDKKPDNLFLIESSKGIQISISGITGLGGSLFSYLSNVFKILDRLKKETKGIEIAYFKLPFVTSYFYLSLINPTKYFKYTISHLVGDPEKALVATKGSKYFVLSKVIYYVTKWCMAKTDISIYVSKNLKQKYHKSNDQVSIVVNESRISIHNIENSGRSLKNDEPVKLVYLGRLSPEKNINKLLFALKELKDDPRKYILNIIGDGPLRDDLMKMCKELDIMDNVIFHGRVTWGNELFEMLSENDILLLPSKTEGLPLVLIEAMSVGVPCIASNVGGIPEIINGVNGILVEPNDINGIKAAIKKISSSPSHYESYSKAAIDTAKNNSLERQMEILKSGIELSKKRNCANL